MLIPLGLTLSPIYSFSNFIFNTSGYRISISIHSKRLAAISQQKLSISLFLDVAVDRVRRNAPPYGAPPPAYHPVAYALQPKGRVGPAYTFSKTDPATSKRVFLIDDEAGIKTDNK